MVGKLYKPGQVDLNDSSDDAELPGDELGEDDFTSGGEDSEDDEDDLSGEDIPDVGEESGTASEQVIKIIYVFQIF